jgi:hypothetical protein
VLLIAIRSGIRGNPSVPFMAERLDAKISPYFPFRKSSLIDGYEDVTRVLITILNMFLESPLIMKASAFV